MEETGKNTEELLAFGTNSKAEIFLASVISLVGSRTVFEAILYQISGKI